MKVDDDQEAKGYITEEAHQAYTAWQHGRIQAAARGAQRNEELESLHDSALDGRAYVRELDKQFGLGLTTKPAGRSAPVPLQRTLVLPKIARASS